MNIKNNWRDFISLPFTGWRFVFNFAVAWVLLLVVKSLVAGNGIILGAIPATAILFLLAWFAGLPYAVKLVRAKKVSEKHNPTQPFFSLSKNKLVKAGGIFLIIAISLYASILLFKEVRFSYRIEKLCIPAIDYRGTVYVMKDKEFFVDAPYFRTYDEAMRYCKLMVRQYNEEK